MTFLAPWFLLGLLAAGIPLLLHLRRSRRADKIIFSTTQFFDQRFIRSSRKARIQDLLLMILRMALLAALALALAQPLVHLPGFSGILGGSGPRKVAIVLDNSASMTARSDRGTSLERAKAGAMTILDSLSPAQGDEATIVLAGLQGGGPRVLFNKPTSDLAQLRDAVRQVQPTGLGTDLDSAIAAANNVLGGKHDAAGRHEVYVLSDLQNSAFSHGRPIDLGPTTALTLVRTGPGAAAGDTSGGDTSGGGGGSAGGAADLSIDAVQYGAARPMLGVPFTFRTLVTNHSAQPRRVSVNLILGDETISHEEVDLPANRSQVVRFAHRFTAPGWFKGRVALSGAAALSDDAIAVNNQRYFALHVAQRVRVLAVDGAPSPIEANDELFFFRLALSVNPEAASGGAAPAVRVSRAPIRVQMIAPVQLSAAALKGQQLVVLANVGNLSDAALQALEQFVDQGGSAFIALGDRVQPQAYNQWIGANRLHGGLLPASLGPLRTADDADGNTAAPAGHGATAPAFIAGVDGQHPMLAGFGAGDLGSLTDVRLTQWYALDPRGGQVLMRDQTGAPLMVEKHFGRGRVMLFAATLDRDWTNFPLDPTYVPFLYRVVGYLSQQSVSSGNFVRTGAIVALPRATTQMQPQRVKLPSGDFAYPEPDPRQPNQIASAVTQTQQAGVYVVQPASAGTDGAATLMFAANVPPSESQPQYVNPDEAKQLVAPETPLAFLGNPEALGNPRELARHGYGLWDVLLWLTLIVAVGEPWIANRLSQRKAARARDALKQRDVAPIVKPVEQPVAA